MNYVFDTSAILLYLKGTTQKELLDQQYDPFAAQHTVILPVVVLRELESMALRNNWGINRVHSLQKFLQKFLIADIHSMDVIKRYAEIDAFSQGKLKGRPLGTSARNMGKNDLWIASIASVAKGKLITADQDFQHLDSVFFDLILMTV